MIPVKLQSEPITFNDNVRKKGTKYLNTLAGAIPTTEQWNKHRYWTLACSDLQKSYNHICAYVGCYVPPCSSPNVEHYIPKSVRPDLAYEWSNYRLAFSLVNSVQKRISRCA